MVNNAVPLMISSEWRNLQPAKQMREINKRWMLQYKQEASLYWETTDLKYRGRERARKTARIIFSSIPLRALRPNSKYVKYCHLLLIYAIYNPALECVKLSSCKLTEQKETDITAFHYNQTREATVSICFIRQR